MQCTVCPVGSVCKAAGATLASLPLLRGYYRISTASSDLRRCPDHSSSSGCIGGVGDGEGPCKPWLQGPCAPRVNRMQHLYLTEPPPRAHHLDATLFFASPANV